MKQQNKFSLQILKTAYILYICIKINSQVLNRTSNIN